jgi:hypothetical protein
MSQTLDIDKSWECDRRGMGALPAARPGASQAQSGSLRHLQKWIHSLDLAELPMPPRLRRRHGVATARALPFTLCRGSMFNGVVSCRL